jgi:hypothetical protein
MERKVVNLTLKDQGGITANYELNSYEYFGLDL